MIGIKQKNQKGFSLLELIIAISLFTGLILMITQIFLKVNESQRNIIVTQNIQENMKYVFEVMGKEIRNSIRATDDSCISSGNIYEETGNTTLKFINQFGKCVTYELKSDTNGIPRLAVTREGSAQVYATPDNIQVDNLYFEVDSSNQEKVTILMDVKAIWKETSEHNMKIQTTVSARLFDEISSPATPPVCGDGTCNGSEDCLSCPGDCVCTFPATCGGGGTPGVCGQSTTYTLTYTAGSNGSLSGNTSQTVNAGDDGTAVTAVPDGGYGFVDWSDGSTDNPRIDTNVTSDITVTANFSLLSGFVSTWKTDNTGVSNDNQIKLPLVSTGNYNFVVKWGDGTSDTITSYNQAEITHSYGSPGTYSIGITGTIKGWSFGFGASDAEKLISISKWGPLNLGNEGYNFYGAVNMTKITTSDILDLSGITNLSYAFYNCKFNTIPNINSWDTSNVTDMKWMFYGVDDFNDDIGGWDTSNVTDMSRMFFGAYHFNQNIDAWDVSSVTNMQQMFQDDDSFNQPLNSWDVSSVTNMHGMFSGLALFNQPLNNWQVGNVTRMSEMFVNAHNFNQNINSWDVSNVIYMYGMFFGASDFNQPLNSWVVSSATDMRSIFQNSILFNQDLSMWDVDQVTGCLNYDSNTPAWILPKPNFTSCTP